jgi:uncharacterized membrane protein (UPF0136 family)
MDIFQATGNTATALLSGVTTGAQTTLASVAPVIELVVGIILAFVLARYLIGLFRHVGKTK